MNHYRVMTGLCLLSLLAGCSEAVNTEDETSIMEEETDSDGLDSEMQNQAGDAGGGTGEDSCEDELAHARSLLEDSSECSSEADCSLLLTESVTLAEGFKNGAGYVVVNTSADSDAIKAAARVLKECKKALGPNGVGVDESRIACIDSRCALNP
ncbi:MAG: hypothetical protein MK135_08095 [Polyangiaceae bacterium]|nr:hypothetical protein [Polyangiaceae bacterium]